MIDAVLGLVIFAGWTAFDFQRLRRTKDLRQAPLLAAFGGGDDERRHGESSNCS